MNIYLMLAELVLAVHLLFILWVIGGIWVVRRYPSLRWLHIGSLVYGIVIEIIPWPPCPLTTLEQELENRAGIVAYHGSFLTHYLEALVYPNLPLTLLVSGAIVFCAANIVFYASQSRIRRLLRSGRPQESRDAKQQPHVTAE
jgi:Protein of Unknown function (DUF2784)